MKIVTATTMRELERRTIEEFNIKGEVLMDRAGFGVANTVRRLADVSGFSHAFIHVIAGRGNNGGDAFCAARHLKELGFTVEVWLAGSINQVTGDASIYLSKLKGAKIRVEELPTMEDWQAARGQPLPAEIIVDGVLGTGITGPARGPAAGAIQYIRAQANESLVVSIDVPSGLHADTGRTEGDTVMADITATMGLPKLGLVEPAAIDYVGTLEVVDIGLPREVVADAEADEREFIYLTDLQPLFPRRKRDTHKGSYGHVLLLGGARGYSGAISLAARAAARSGAGLVSAIVPEGVAARVAVASPETMVVGAPENNEGALAAAALTLIRSRLDKVQAVLIGPGLSRGDDALTLVRAVVRESPVPVIVDADALVVMEGQVDNFNKARHPITITPHPGEMAALLRREVADVQADRIGTATRVAHSIRGVVVLKGAGTVVACEGKPTQINITGNPGMATGGTGDVLAGLLAGLLAQGYSAYDAARAAVYVHGRAGDLAAWRKCQVSLIASDVIDELPFAFRDLTLR
jgi:hydroxyethylthiazole kinase-like uncharacterized protein yjeF